MGRKTWRTLTASEDCCFKFGTHVVLNSGSTGISTRSRKVDAHLNMGYLCSIGCYNARNATGPPNMALTTHKHLTPSVISQRLSSRASIVHHRIAIPHCQQERQRERD